MKFKDKVVLITGGSRGIGRAIALMFAKEGAKVFINFLKNKALAEEVAKEAQAAGGTCKLVQGDVKNEEDAIRIIDEIVNECGTVDVLVNNAGMTKDTLLISMEKQDWDDVLSTNLDSVYNFTRAVAPHMMMQKSGKIINVSSFSSMRGGRGQCNYAASKGAINAFTRAVALELAPKGINVNAVAPGMIETDMSKTVRGLTNDTLVKKIPLARYGKPEDVAKLIGFLASADADYITGEVITVDGGMMIGI